MIVTVKKIGGSVAVLIPKTVAREMQISEGTSLSLTAGPDGIVLRRPGKRARRPLNRIVAQINPADYRRRSKDLLADPPVGKEIG